MRKIFTTFLALFGFVFFLILPVLLGLHSSMMSHHDMSTSDCIEHCMSSEGYLNSPRIISLSNYIDIVVIKVVFIKIFEFAIPLTLLCILLTHAPPNLSYDIKNYNYSSLIGIVKLTT